MNARRNRLKQKIEGRKRITTQDYVELFFGDAASIWKENKRLQLSTVKIAQGYVFASADKKLIHTAALQFVHPNNSRCVEIISIKNLHLLVRDAQKLLRIK